MGRARAQTYLHMYGQTTLETLILRSGCKVRVSPRHFKRKGRRKRQYNLKDLLERALKGLECRHTLAEAYVK